MSILLIQVTFSLVLSVLVITGQEKCVIFVFLGLGNFAMRNVFYLGSFSFRTQDFILFNGSVVFHSICLQQLVNPITGCWASGLISYLSYCELSRYKQGGY